MKIFFINRSNLNEKLFNRFYVLFSLKKSLSLFFKLGIADLYKQTNFFKIKSNICVFKQ